MSYSALADWSQEEWEALNHLSDEDAWRVLENCKTLEISMTDIMSPGRTRGGKTPGLLQGVMSATYGTRNERGEIDYVGSTNDMYRRIAQHKDRGGFSGKSALVVWALPKHLAVMVEVLLIDRFASKLTNRVKSCVSFRECRKRRDRARYEKRRKAA